jgi:membrane carboxypeptidase/penicillin-binding protein PbpC
VVGYTPDFVVGVWLGNSENTALAQVSGQSGAGAVWHDVMEYLLSSSYNSKRSFTQSGVRLLTVNKKEEWGLTSDDPEDHRTLLTSNALITSIHEGDMFEYEDGTHIPLRARVPLIWFANGKNIGEGNEVTFTPDSPGRYEIEGKRIDNPSVREILNININLQNR